MSTTLSPTAEELVHANLGLVYTIAHRIGRTRTLRVLSIDDLIGHGMEGLVRAARSYDPHQGTPFASWAIVKIGGAIRDALREIEDPLARSQRVHITAIQHATDQLTQRGQHSPRVADLMAATGLSRARVTEMQRLSALRQVSLDAKRNGGGDESSGLMDVLADDDPASDPVAVYEQAQEAAIVQAVLDALPPREREIVRRYDLSGQSLREIAATLGISDGRVSQLRGRGLAWARQFYLARTADLLQPAA